MHQQGFLAQEHRKQRAAELQDILESLWSALNTPADDVDRGIFTRLMSGPAHLHAKTLDKVGLLCFGRSQRALSLLATAGLKARVTHAVYRGGGTARGMQGSADEGPDSQQTEGARAAVP